MEGELAADRRKKGVFFDRDGTVIYDTGYLRDPRLIKFRPDAISALHGLQERGYALVLVSNQSGVGRGRISTVDAQRVHDAMVEQLSANNVRLNAAYYCFHAPEEKCNCRKPSPALLLRAADDLNIDLTTSFMVGDRSSDIEAGKGAGCFTILLSEEVNGGAVHPHQCARDWREIEQVIANRSKHGL